MPTEMLVLLVAGLMLVSFVLGYTAAEQREHAALKQTRLALAMLKAQRNQLRTFVQDNWPNEFEAYRWGHIDGYQQGVTHSPELEERAKMIE